RGPDHPAAPATAAIRQPPPDAGSGLPGAPGRPLVGSPSSAGGWAHGPLLGQGRRGREAPSPLSEAPRAKAGPSTRGNAAEGEVSRTCAGVYRAPTPRPTTTTPNARRIPTLA